MTFLFGPAKGAAYQKFPRLMTRPFTVLRLELVAGGGGAVSEEAPALLEVGPACLRVAGGDGLAVDGVVLEVRVLRVPHVANADL